MVFAELIQVIELEPLFTGAPMRLWNCDVLPRRTPTPSYTGRAVQGGKKAPREGGAS